MAVEACTVAVIGLGNTVTRKSAPFVGALVVLAMLRLFGWKAWIDDSLAAQSLHSAD